MSVLQIQAKIAEPITYIFPRFIPISTGTLSDSQIGVPLFRSSKLLRTEAVILPGITICDHVVIGAGAVVTKDITEPGTYVGVPARRQK